MESQVSIAILSKMDEIMSIKNISLEDVESLLLRQAISSCPEDGEDMDSNDEKIMQIYEDNFKIYKGQPDFSDIMQDIFDYNDTIFEKIAMIHYESELQVITRESFYHGMTKEDAIAEITREIVEENWYDFFSELESYVSELLSDKKCYYTIWKMSEDFEEYFKGETGNNVIACVNDCQNVLFSKFFEYVDYAFNRYIFDKHHIIIKSD